MIRLAKLTDYGIMLLTYFARDPGSPVRSARQLAAATRLPLPTVSKILKTLAHRGLLSAHRGVKGGFSLVRSPREVTVAEIIGAIEGGIGITECSGHPGECEVERVCIVRNNWKRINESVLEALRGITLEEMTRPWRAAAAPVAVAFPRAASRPG